MSTFTVKKNIDRATQFAGDNFGKAMQNKTKLSFTTYNDQTLVYCNQPEAVLAKHFVGSSAATTNYYVNRSSVKKGDCMVYASYDLLGCPNGYFAIRIYNPNSTSVTVKKVNEGFSHSGSWDLAINAWKQFSNGVSESAKSIAAKSSIWITTKSVTPSSNRLLEYLMKFTTTGDVYVAVYFCTSISKIPADGGTYIPRNGEESYSGTARKFYISTSKTLYAADAMASYYNSYFFGLTPYNGKVTNTNEHNPITLVQGGTASETALNKSDRNLGNWGLQYAMNFTLKNNYSKPVKFKGYIISNPISHCAGIRSGNSVDGVFLEPNESNENPDNNRWQFFESTTLPANTGSVTIDFQYMHLSKGNAPCLMQFEVVPA